MAVTQHGWSTSVQADSYFSDERHVTTLWDALADNDAKNKVLNMAYNRIYYSNEFSVPAKGDETTAQLVALIKAQSEMSYYLLMHLADEDRRKGLQAQSVKHAGIVKEIYDEDSLNKLPIPPIVRRLLAGYYKFATPFYSVDIDRDEDEAVSEDVVDV
jgi:hypothetical protein